MGLCMECERLRLELERCKIQWDRMASRVMLTERELRWMCRRSGNQTQRTIDAERKRREAQHALEAAIRSAPSGRTVQILLQTEKLLAALSRGFHGTCVSCGFRNTIGHRTGCRIITCLDRIASVVGFSPLPSRSRLLRSPALPRKAPAQERQAEVPPSAPGRHTQRRE